MLRVLFIFAHFLGVLSLTFVLPALAASMAGEPELVTSFVITGVLGLFVSGSLVLGLRGREQRLKRHERYLLAALLFIGLPIFAAIPIGLSVPQTAPIDAYFEFHIEQGPELHEKRLPLGIVTGGFKSHGMNVIFRGETAHSGPTPMDRRHNALVGAAKFISAVNDIGWAHAPIGKSTASRVSLWPNKNGILPDYAETTVDMRHRDQAVTDAMVAQARAALADAARAAQVEYEIEAEWTFGDETFDTELIELVSTTARAQGIEPLRMHSQAGHDAYNLCRVAPTALIFCPCIDGITHNEAEDIAREPTLEAANVVLHAVLARADR